MQHKKTLLLIFLLTLIFLTAFVLRIFRLGSVPPSLNWDETAQGYNAYSILNTGRDEHKKPFPHPYLTSFGDFKPPIYTYAIIPSIIFFKLNEFAVRFPSAFFGSLTVLVTYLLVRKLFPKNACLALLTAVLLAVSPWHIQLSRGAYEANLASFFAISGIYCFLKGLGKNWFFIVSAFFFSLSFYTFNTPRVFIPLLGIALAVAFYKKIYQAKKWAVISLILFIILSIPLMPHLLSEEGRLRFKEVNIFSDIQPLTVSNTRIELDGNKLWARFLHNRRLAYAQIFLKHYFDNFKFNYLFFSGDRNPRFSLQTLGQLYLIELPFLALGFLHLLRLLIKKRDKKVLFLFLWFLVSFIPASLARETPHALRTELVLPTYQIIAAYGILVLMKFFKNKKATGISIALFYLISVFYFLHNYFSHYPKEYASEWQYGYKQLVEYVFVVENNYDQIYISPHLGRPYIYFLFYKKYQPELFWQTKKENTEPFGIRKVLGFDKYIFDTSLISKGGKKLFAVTKGEIEDKSHKIQKIIYQPNGESVFFIYEE